MAPASLSSSLCASLRASDSSLRSSSRSRMVMTASRCSSATRSLATFSSACSSASSVRVFHQWPAPSSLLSRVQLQLLQLTNADCLLVPYRITSGSPPQNGHFFSVLLMASPRRADRLDAAACSGLQSRSLVSPPPPQPTAASARRATRVGRCARRRLDPRPRSRTHGTVACARFLGRSLCHDHGNTAIVLPPMVQGSPRGPASPDRPRWP